MLTAYLSYTLPGSHPSRSTCGFGTRTCPVRDVPKRRGPTADSTATRGFPGQDGQIAPSFLGRVEREGAERSGRQETLVQGLVLPVTSHVTLDKPTPCLSALQIRI